jgi:hypothetical protein
MNAVVSSLQLEYPLPVAPAPAVFQPAPQLPLLAAVSAWRNSVVVAA